MKFRFTPVLIVVFAFIGSVNAFGQGCVAIKSVGCSGSNNSSVLGKNQFEFQTNLRYFESFRHFVGDVQQHERLEKHTEVRIKSFNYDVGFNYGLTERTFLSVAIPFVVNDRSNNHYTDNDGIAHRFSVQARGLGDVRATAYHWFVAPSLDKKISFLAGLGLKLPTGNPTMIDLFHAKSIKGTDSTYFKIVDQAIQPGDGGFGISLEAQLNYQFARNLSVFTTGYYLLAPQGTSNVTKSSSLSTTNTIENYLSICDQYLARIGVNYQSTSKNPISVSLGGRVEGIPSEDLIGSSSGRRRPGYVVSAEPSIGLQFGSNRVSLAVPVALYRNRTKSVYDKSDPEGLRHGDAAFSDYFLNVSFAHRFGGKAHEMMAPATTFPNVKN